MWQTRKLSVVPGVALVVLALAGSAAAGPPSELWQQFLQNPAAPVNMPNGSYAGYHYGEKPLPNVPVVVNVRDFGAVPDDGQTDLTAIQAAIDKAGEMGGGAVLVPAGRYVCDGELTIAHSRVVLRGEHQQKTVLYFPKSLSDLKGYKASWSYGGSLLFISPPVPRDAGKVVATRVIGEARRGDDRVVVEDAGGIQAGQYLEFVYPPSVELYRLLVGNVPAAEHFGWDKNAANMMRSGYIRRYQVVAIEGNTLRLKRPLEIDHPTWLGVQVRPVVRMIEEVGLENLTIAFGGTQWLGHLKQRGFNGPMFNRAFNCWARDITLYHADIGMMVVQSNNVTLTRITLDGPRDANVKAHHGVLFATSNDSLLWDFDFKGGVHHGIDMTNTSSGIVFARGRMLHGGFDSHRTANHSCIRTEIIVRPDGGPGGSRDKGPQQGAWVVNWNIRVVGPVKSRGLIFMPSVYPRGALVGIQGLQPTPVDELTHWERSGAFLEGDTQTVIESQGRVPEPANLYLAQLEHRLGRDHWLAEPSK